MYAYVYHIVHYGAKYANKPLCSESKANHWIIRTTFQRLITRSQLFGVPFALCDYTTPRSGWGHLAEQTKQSDFSHTLREYKCHVTHRRPKHAVRAVQPSMHNEISGVCAPDCDDQSRKLGTPSHAGMQKRRSISVRVWLSGILVYINHVRVR